MDDVGATRTNTFSGKTPHSFAIESVTSAPGNLSASRVRIAISASSSYPITS